MSTLIWAGFSSTLSLFARPLRPYRTKPDQGSFESVNRVLGSEVPPEPPLLETDFRPVNHPRWSPGSRIGRTIRRPSGRICGSICRSASSAERQQSYGMKPEIDRSSFTGYFNRQIVRQHIGFLMRHATGLGCRHVCTVADCVHVVPFGF